MLVDEQTSSDEKHDRQTDKQVMKNVTDRQTDRQGRGGQVVKLTEALWMER
jgi:hypothetical protein